LRGWSDILVYGQMGKKSFNFRFRREQLFAGAHVVVVGKPDDPVDIGSLGVDGIVLNPEDPTDLFQELGRLTFEWGRHSIFPQSRHAVRLITGIGQKCPKTKLLFHYQGKIAC
jgi:hypothetical protein